MSSILALPLPRPPLRVGALACVLSRMTPGLDDLLTEAADEAAQALRLLDQATIGTAENGRFQQDTRDADIAIADIAGGAR